MGEIMFHLCEGGYVFCHSSDANKRLKRVTNVGANLASGVTISAKQGQRNHKYLVETNKIDSEAVKSGSRPKSAGC